MRLTRESAAFAAGCASRICRAEAVRLARRCVLDGLGVQVAGTEQPAMAVLGRHVRRIGGAPEARLVGDACLRLPAHLAALWNGLAGHAMDRGKAQRST